MRYYFRCMSTVFDLARIPAYQSSGVVVAATMEGARQRVLGMCPPPSPALGDVVVWISENFTDEPEGHTLRIVMTYKSKQVSFIPRPDNPNHQHDFIAEVFCDGHPDEPESASP